MPPNFSQSLHFKIIFYSLKIYQKTQRSHTTIFQKIFFKVKNAHSSYLHQLVESKLPWLLVKKIVRESGKLLLVFICVSICLSACLCMSTFSRKKKRRIANIVTDFSTVAVSGYFEVKSPNKNVLEEKAVV